ncbi:MAG: hypothetical protein AAB738_02500 [Patescibacteria group bacterium]
MIYLIVGFACLLAFAMLAIIAAGKVQNKKREEKGGKEPAEKTGWLQTPSGKNLKTAAILTAIYLTGFWLLYGPLAHWIQSHFGCTETESSVMVTLFGLAFVFPAVWLLYSAANIPGDPKTIKRGMRAIAFAMLFVLAYFKLSGPSELFNPENGNPKFWTDKTTGEMVYDPSADPSKTRFSSRSGYRLELGKPEDVKNLKFAATGNQKGLVKEVADGLKNRNSIPIDTIPLGEFSDEFLTPPPTSGWVVYAILPGNYEWCQPISWPKGRQVTTNIYNLTWVVGFNPTTGEWKEAKRSGPGYTNGAYFNGLSAMSWHTRSTVYYIPAYWT